MTDFVCNWLGVVESEEERAKELERAREEGRLEAQKGSMSRAEKFMLASVVISAAGLIWQIARK